MCPLFEIHCLFFMKSLSLIKMSVIVKAYKPGELLSSFVAYYWEGNFNDQAQHLLSQRVIPNGFVELIIHLTDWHCDLFSCYGWSQSPNYTIIGLHTRPYEVHFSDHVRVFGIRFKPEGIFNIFGIPAAEFKERYEDVSQVLGRAIQTFSDQLREKSSIEERLALAELFLSNTAQKNHIHLNYINRAAELIRQSKGAMKIDELPDKVCISLRQLERGFKEKIGISPKHYLRISRVNEVYNQLRENQVLNFAELAYQTGYTDQAHFIKEFKNLTGAKPTIFIKDREQFVVNPEVAPDFLDLS